jgi:MFS family permease
MSGGHRDIRAWYVVSLLGVVYFVAFADRLALSLLVEPIRKELGVSDTQMGFLFGLSFALTLVAFSLPLGRLADRVSRRGLIAVTISVWGLLTMLSGFAHSFSELLICRVGVGIGEAGLSPAALSLISDLFPAKRRAAPISVYLTAGIGGATGSFLLLGILLRVLNSAGPVALPVLGLLTPWRAALICVGAPTIILAALVALTVQEPRREIAVKGTLSGAWRYLTNRSMRYGPMFIAFSLMAMLSIAASAWYPTYLIREFGLSASQAGLDFGAAAIAGGVGGSFAVPMMASALESRSSRDSVFALGIACVAVGPACLVASIATSVVVLKLALLAFANFCFIGGINLPAVELQAVGPANQRGQLAAIYFMCVNIGGLGLGPILVAFLARSFFSGRHGLGSALVALAILAGPLSVAALQVARSAAIRRNGGAARAGGV